MKKNNYVVYAAAALIAAFALIFSGCPTGNEENEGEASGTVAITGNTWVGATLTADISGLDGTGAVEYQWAVNSEEIDSGINQTYQIQKREKGATITVKARRKGQEGWVESAPTGAVINGYMVKTISINAVGDDGVSSDTGRIYQYAKNIIVDNDGKFGPAGNLYFAADVAYRGNGIYVINPADTAGADGFINAKEYATENRDAAGNHITSNFAGGAEYLATDGNSLYVGIKWGKDRVSERTENRINDQAYILRFDTPVTNAFNWNSGNIFTKIKAEHSYYKDDNQSYVGIAVDSAGIMYVGTTFGDNGAHGVLKVAADGTVSVLAGTNNDTAKDPYAEGQGTTAKFNQLSGITVDAAGNVYVADGYNAGRIRKITPAGQTSTFAGGVWGSPFWTMGRMSFDKNGNLFVINRMGQDQGVEMSPTICQVSPDGQTVNTIAGKGGARSNAAPADWNTVDGVALTDASFFKLHDVAVANDGTIYVLDGSDNHIVVRKIYFDAN